MHDSLGLPAPFDVNLLDPRQVLMVPLTEPNQTIFTLTNPESYGEADLFVFEIPDYFQISHSDFGLYLLLDMSTQYKATVMLQS